MATTATARSEPDLYGRIATPLHTILVLAAQGSFGGPRSNSLGSSACNGEYEPDDDV